MKVKYKIFYAATLIDKDNSKEILSVAEDWCEDYICRNSLNSLLNDKNFIQLYNNKNKQYVFKIFKLKINEKYTKNAFSLYMINGFSLGGFNRAYNINIAKKIKTIDITKETLSNSIFK